MRKRAWLTLALVGMLAMTAALAVGGCGKKKPGLSAISPSSGEPGSEMTLTGKDFGDTQGGGQVNFGTAAAAVVSWSDTSIVIKVPSGQAAGAYEVSVKTDGGTSAALTYEVIEAPAAKPELTSLTPSTGPAGTTLTINGSGLGGTQGGSEVLIGQEKAAVVSWSDSVVKVKVPGGLADGAYEVRVTAGAGTSNSIPFQVQAADTGNTPERAIREYMTAQGMDPDGWVYKKSISSSLDPGWSLYDYQRYEGMAHTQFLLHKTGDAWEVVASGGDDFDPQAHGAPDDLKFF